MIEALNGGQTMFSKRSIERLAGIFLVTSFVVFLGHFVALLSDHVPTVILFVFIYGFLVILSALTLYPTFRTHERTLARLGAFGLAAHGLFVILFCSVLLANLEFAQGFAAAEADVLAAAASAFEVTALKILTCGLILLALALAALGVLIARSGAVARWVGWLGVVGGILGFLGQFTGLFDVDVGEAASILRAMVFLTSFGFILILGIRLVVRETREATAGTPHRGTNRRVARTAEPA